MNDFQVNIKAVEQQMESAIKHLVTNLDGIRTSRASTSLLDSIMVEQYGSMVPLKQVGLVSLLDSTALKISVFDNSMISEVKKVIREKLQLDATEMDGGLKVVVPPLTDERRKQYIKYLNEVCESSKITIRNIRKSAFDEIKNFKSKISEDDTKRQQKSVDTVHDKYIKTIDTLSAEKTKALQS